MGTYLSLKCVCVYIYERKIIQEDLWAPFQGFVSYSLSFQKQQDQLSCSSFGFASVFMEVLLNCQTRTYIETLEVYILSKLTLVYAYHISLLQVLNPPHKNVNQFKSHICTRFCFYEACLTYMMVGVPSWSCLHLSTYLNCSWSWSIFPINPLGYTFVRS